MVVFVSDFQSVGRPQGAEHFAKRHDLLSSEATDMEASVQIPQGQPMRGEIKIAVVGDGKPRLVPLQRVGVRDQVTARPVRLNQLHHAGIFIHPNVGQILLPPERDIRDLQGLEDVIPEFVVNQETAQLTEEFSGLRTLNNPVVISRGDSN